MESANIEQYWATKIWIRDNVAEEEYRKRTGHDRCIYRRVRANEMNRGKLYPIFNSGLDLMAHFGVGVGIYYAQLLILAGITFIGGFLLIPSILAYSNSSYANVDTTGYLSLTAVCSNTIYVNATSGCGDNEILCEATYRPSCELSSTVIVFDIIVSLFIAAATMTSVFVEKQIENKLDEAIQSTQDYSLIVKDPDPDATNPDEWYKFFSRFGKVRIITVTKANAKLGRKLLEKDRVIAKIKELSKLNNSMVDTLRVRSCFCFKSTFDPAYWEQKLIEIDNQLSSMYLENYPACKVFVTFEYEEEKRLALSELEVPDIEAIFDIKTNRSERSLFRGSNVLDIVEPPEPDNIKWLNLETTSRQKKYRRYLTITLTLALLITSYFVIYEAQLISPTVLSIVVVFLDSLLCYIFKKLTDYEGYPDDAKVQSSLQLKLFGVRLLLSTIFPYLSIKWNTFLDQDVLSNIVSVQITTCFAGSFLSIINLPGLFKKYFVAQLFSSTQEDMNSNWVGSEWDLAERYTVVSKILFISLFYSMLTPMSIFICSIAFVVTFQTDRYLLLRYWKEPPLLNADVSKRLRQQMLLCVAAHMFITCRFVYSWPMDQAYFNPTTQEYVKVNKRPGTLFLSLSHHEVWQSDTQRRLLGPYEIATGISCLLVLYSWVINPVMLWLHRLFFKELEFNGDSQKIPFSALKDVSAFTPIITDIETSKDYIFADTSQMKTEHLPGIKPEATLNDDVICDPNNVTHKIKGNPPDLSVYIPPQYRCYVLAVVKWYGDDIEKDGNTKPQQRNSLSSAASDLNNNIKYDNENITDPLIGSLASLNTPQATSFDSKGLTSKEFRVLQIIGAEAFAERMKKRTDQSIQSSNSDASLGINSTSRKAITSGLKLSSSASVLPSSVDGSLPSLASSQSDDLHNSLELQPIKKSLLDTATLTRNRKYPLVDIKRSINNRNSLLDRPRRLNNNTEHTRNRSRSGSRDNISEPRSRSGSKGSSDGEDGSIPELRIRGKNSLLPIDEMRASGSATTSKYSDEELSILLDIRREMTSIDATRHPKNRAMNFAEFYSNILISCPNLVANASKESNRKLRTTLRSIFMKTIASQEREVSNEQDAGRSSNELNRNNVILWSDWVEKLLSGDLQ